ncbi:cytochrome b5-related protein-like isoform X2 [Wyeomyia smithii]|uniref:cytochrome b5-related protein-like isoform X2 n=1 Tax=Wyeomyia smithii TaxID=174621 RepID=UPI002467FF26|nr:cytochrome b5-related protein-like isoform X2 [Wyeomyia smithii]
MFMVRVKIFRPEPDVDMVNLPSGSNATGNPESYSALKYGAATSITTKEPTFRKSSLKTVYRWLEAKRQDDRAEGLWRIHDDLYDLTEFIGRHPGGADWIRLTKGTDITEVFEMHHIRNYASQLLPMYKVRVAHERRTIRYTFHEQGFYRTLKRKVSAKLETLDQRPARYSEIIQDLLMISTFALAWFATYMNSYLVAALCGWILALTMICAHNFFHRKDNWRMLIFNLAFLSYREWRISHVISHHSYPNSIQDLELLFFEPFLCWFVHPKKSLLQRFGSWFLEPIVYAVLLSDGLIKRIVETCTTENNTFFVEDMIPLVLPIFLYSTCSQSLTTVLIIWTIILIVASFLFGFIGLSAAHHHPAIVHSGDLLPSEIDFGVYQLAATADSSDKKVCQFQVLTGFGDHCLHHLFPTMDHGMLAQLYPTFLETCAEFELEYQEFSWWQMFVGQYRQLARIIPSDYLVSSEKNI